MVPRGQSPTKLGIRLSETFHLSSELSQHLLGGLAQNVVQTFMFSR